MSEIEETPEDRSRHGRRRRYQPRTVNLLALVIVFVATAGLGAGLYFLHGFQLRRNAAALLRQSHQAEDEKDTGRAADYLMQYLALTPNDTDNLAHYAALVEKRAVTRRQKIRPFFLLEEVLRRTPERDDLRRHVVRLALDLGLLNDARHHLEKLGVDLANPIKTVDAELLRLEAERRHSAREFQLAAQLYDKVVRLEPTNVSAWEQLLVLRRDQATDPEDADPVATDMVTANPRSTAARLAAARHFVRRGAVDQAVEHVRFAQDQLLEGGSEVALLAADLAVFQGRLDEARKHLERGLKKSPSDVDLRLAAARVEARRGDLSAARRQLEPFRKALPDKPEQLCELGAQLVDLGATDQVGPILTRLRPPATAWAWGLVRGRLLVRDKRWGEARLELERLRGVRFPRQSWVVQTELLLADCHQALGNPDQQAEALRRALAGDPTSTRVRARLATVLAATGKVDQAAASAAALPGGDVEMVLTQARVLTARQLARSERERDWSAVEKALERLPVKDREALQVVTFRAELALLRRQAGEARRLAEGARARDPKQVAPWLLLVEVARAQGSPVRTLALIDEAERQVGPHVEWQLARAREIALAGGRGALSRLRRLEEERQRLTGTNRDRLTAGLARAFGQLGDPKTMEALWRELAERQPGNLDVRLRLADMAYRAGRVEELRTLAAEVERAEGEGGPGGAYLQAMVSLTRPGRDGFGEARRHLARAAKLRPTWSRVPALEGEIDDREGRREAAVKNYTAAIELGETRVNVLQRAVQLLFELRRFPQADALLRRLPEEVRLSSEMGRLSARLTLVSPDAEGDPKGQRRRALEVARKVVAAGTSDYRNLLFLGQMAALAGEPKEAEQALVRAREMAPEEPAAWVALVQLLARLDPKRARVELAEAERKLPAKKAALALAGCHELLGQQQEAKKHYDAALLAEPGNAEVLSAVAGYLTRGGQEARAEALWRKTLALTPPPADDVLRVARRALAIQLARKRTYEAYKEALALAEANLGTHETVEDRRVRALVLATQPAERTEAIRQFESLGQLSANTPPDMLFLLAGLYEADGNRPKLLACIGALLQAAPNNPLCLASAARVYLQEKNLVAARTSIDRLEKVAGGRFEVVELRARWLHENDKADEARRLLERYASGNDDRLLPAALALQELGQDEAAERLLRRGAALPGRPAALLHLTRHLARRGRVEEAWRLCEEAWEKVRPEDAGALSLDVLRLTRARPEDLERVAGQVAAARKKHPTSLGLLALLAELEGMRGRHDAMIECYRQLLRLRPDHVLALNNLAYYLSVKEVKHGEALEMITRVLDALGPVGEILDTRGLIRLGADQPREAVKDFQAALKQAPVALRYFHLAQAQLALGERSNAQASWLRAKRLGLKKEGVPELERQALKKLVEALETE